MSQHHSPDCAFAMSFGDLGCDCTGPVEAATPVAEDGSRLTATAREHLAAARAALHGPKAGA